MKAIRLGENIATLHGLNWISDDPTTENLLRTMTDSYGPDVSDPDPEAAILRALEPILSFDLVQDTRGPLGGDTVEIGTNLDRCEGFLQRLDSSLLDDDGDVPFSGDIAADLMRAFDVFGPGHWVHIKGKNVYIKGAKISPEHVQHAAEMAGLNEEGTKALAEAHENGQIETDHQLYNTVKDAAEGVEQGATHAEAVAQGLDKHGGPAKPKTPKAEIKTHSIPLNTNKKSHKYEDSLEVVSHGHEVDEHHIAATAQMAGLSAKTTATLLDALKEGKIKNDAHLYELISDAHKIHEKTHYFSPNVGVQKLLAGQSVDDILAEHKQLAKEYNEQKKLKKKGGGTDDGATNSGNADGDPAPAAAAVSDDDDVVPLTPKGADATPKDGEAIPPKKNLLDYAHAVKDVILHESSPGSVGKDGNEPWLYDSQSSPNGDKTAAFKVNSNKVFMVPDGSSLLDEAKAAGVEDTDNLSGKEIFEVLQKAGYQAVAMLNHDDSIGELKVFDKSILAPHDASDADATSAPAPTVPDNPLANKVMHMFKSGPNTFLTSSPVAFSQPVSVDSDKVFVVPHGKVLQQAAKDAGIIDSSGATTAATKKALAKAGYDATAHLDVDGNVFMGHLLNEKVVTPLGDTATSDASNSAGPAVKTSPLAGISYVPGKVFWHDEPALFPLNIHNRDADKTVTLEPKNTFVVPYKNGEVPQQMLDALKDAGIYTKDVTVPKTDKAKINFMTKAYAKLKELGYDSVAVYSDHTGKPKGVVLDPSIAKENVKVTPVIPPTTTIPTSNGHVTMQGKKLDVDHSKPVAETDVDALAATPLKITSNGLTAMKEAVKNGDVKTHGQFIESAAIAQAGAKKFGHESINGPGFKEAVSKYGGSIENLLDAAHHGDADAKAMVSHLGAHSFESPAAKKEAEVAAKKALQNAAFLNGTPEDHLHKKVGAKGGSNEGAVYEMPDGQKNYIKLPKNPAAAHSEHLANKIYQSLGISAPNSKVFEHQGKTHYASQEIENTGHIGLNPTKEQAQEILKGFAADALLANWDAVGLSGDNMVIGADGKPHRIDNGGSLLFKATGGLKDATALERLPEWKALADPKVNPNYAKAFAAAGIKSADEIPGINQQIKAILKLRDDAGGWDAFIQKASPGMSAEDRAKVADILEKRTQILQGKLKNQPGGNSLVGARDFKYGTAHDVENQIIAHHKASISKPLTKEQIAAVKSFKGSSYNAWNKGLLGALDLTPADAKKTELLDNLFKRPEMTIGVDVALSRKLNLDTAEIQALKSLPPGTVLGATPVFQSTSVNSAVWHGNVHLCILAPKETPGIPPRAWTDTNQGEQEILLPRGLAYRIVSISSSGSPPPEHTPPGWTWEGGTHIVVEAIVPGVNDVESPNVPMHLPSKDKIESGLKSNSAATALPTPNLSGLPEEMVKQLPNVKTGT